MWEKIESCETLNIDFHHCCHFWGVTPTSTRKWPRVATTLSKCRHPKMYTFAGVHLEWFALVGNRAAGR